VTASLSADTLTGGTATSATLTIEVPADAPSGTYGAVVRATRGTVARAVRVSVRVDSDRPSIAPASLAPRLLSTVERTTFGARLAWAAATDPTNPIASYQVQWNIDGAGWSTSSTFGPSVRSVDRTLAIGASVAVRIRARDAAGNASTWVTSTAFRASVTEDTSTTLSRSAAWWRSNASAWHGGSALVSGSTGQWVTKSFTGRSVAWVAALGPTRGTALVYIDGVKAATVDLQRAGDWYRRVVFARSWSSAGPHTLRVVVAGTAGHSRVDVDAFVVIR
jgi:hypothetical protein